MVRQVESEAGAAAQAAQTASETPDERSTGTRTPATEARAATSRGLTIGAVCKQLEREFPGLSVSKIRYLEDQKLISPRRTPGGYRIYTHADVERLRTILRLQRDEFLPLRVIRQELEAGGQAIGERGAAVHSGVVGRRQPALSLRQPPSLRPASEVLAELSLDPALLRELRDYGIVEGTLRDGELLLDESEREILRVAAELRSYGVGGRNLRVLRTSADREAALLEQLLAPSLRSRNPERRKQALEQLERLAERLSQLRQLMLLRDLRRLAG